MKPRQTWQEALADVERWLKDPEAYRAEWRRKNPPPPPKPFPKYMEGEPDMIVEAEERMQMEKEDRMIHGEWWQR